MAEKITAQKAIENLQRHKGKIASITENDMDAWLNKLRSNVADYFGKESDEYMHSRDFSFYDSSTGMHSPNYLYHFQVTKPKAEAFIDSLIETIKDKGLYTIPRVNFLFRIKSEYLVTILIFLITGLLTIGSLWGKYFSDTQNIELRSENKDLKEKLSKISSVSKDTNNIPYQKRDTTDNGGK